MHQKFNALSSRRSTPWGIGAARLAFWYLRTLTRSTYLGNEVFLCPLSKYKIIHLKLPVAAILFQKGMRSWKILCLRNNTHFPVFPAPSRSRKIFFWNFRCFFRTEERKAFWSQGSVHRLLFLDFDTSERREKKSEILFKIRKKWEKWQMAQEKGMGKRK